MNTYIRTTITLPPDLYEQLRLAAYQEKTSFSGVIQKRLSTGARKIKKKANLLGLAGKYNLKGNQLNRKEFYNALAIRDMALGH
jgi:predicted CopG family antitoxin